MKTAHSRLSHPATAFVVAAASLGFSGSALAIKDAENQGRWEDPCKVGPDAEVPGWFYNLGITGIRAELVKEQPKALLVKYVLKLRLRKPSDRLRSSQHFLRKTRF